LPRRRLTNARAWCASPARGRGRCIGLIEAFALDILGVIRKVSPDGIRQIVVRSIGHNEPVEIRFPNATRSWQHVLECLAGYLILGEQLLSARRECAEAWNFGPNPEDQHTVSAVLRKLQEYWPEIRWQHVPMDQPHEAGLLHLDTSKTRSFLGWQPVWSLGCALSATAQWYRQFAMSGKTLTREQILSYVESAKRSGCSWAA